MNTTRELAREAWGEYFDAVSKELPGADVSIEVAGAVEPLVLEAEHVALRALTYDRHDDVLEVAVARGASDLPVVLRHLIDHPERVAVDNYTMLAPLTIAVDARDGVRTMIRIEREAETTS